MAPNARKRRKPDQRGGENPKKLEAREAVLLNELAERAANLSARRKQAATRLSKGIERELNDLKMAAARFAVDFQTRPDPAGLPLEGGRVAFDSTGFDRVEFLVALARARSQAAGENRFRRRNQPPDAGAQERAGAG